MLILFAMIQATTISILYLNYQMITDQQNLYEDLFITLPIFFTINLTKPATKLSKELPSKSFFSLRPMMSMIGQFLIQLAAQLALLTYLLRFDVFQNEKK